MVDQFCSRSIISPGGLDCLSWIKKYAQPAIFESEKKVTILTADGKTRENLLSKSCLIFNDLKIVREENHQETGGARAILATPVPFLCRLSRCDDGPRWIHDTFICHCEKNLPYTSRRSN